MISKILQISPPSASNFKRISKSIEQFFLTVGNKNFGNKIPFTFRRWCFLCFTQKLVKSIGFFWTKSGSFFSSLSGQISQFVFFSLFFFSSNFLFELSSCFYTFTSFSVSNIKSLRKEKKMNGILEMESLELVINVRTFLLLKKIIWKMKIEDLSLLITDGCSKQWFLL